MKLKPSEKKNLLFTIRQIYKFIILLIAVILIFHYLLENTSLYYRKFFYRSPLALHLNRYDLVMQKGEEFKLKVHGINIRASFSSTNFRVAGVNFNGRVFAYQVGKAFILVKTEKKVMKCRVRVIDINKEKLTLKEGDTYRLKIKGNSSLPSYKSSNSKVASVNLFGKVEAKKKGKTVISVRVMGKTIRCTVIVK